MEQNDGISFSSVDCYSSEEYFERMLILERSKSPKTGKPFILILLDVGKLTKGKPAEKTFVFHKLLSVLNSSIREIDVTGWYMFGTIIGIICKDIKLEHRNRVSGRIRDVLYEKGSFHLVGNKIDAVKLLCFLYPDS
jgi:hypothetical protein